MSQDKLQYSSSLLFISILTMTLLLAGTVVSNKLVTIGFLTQPASAFLYPISFLLFGIVSEVYGYEVSKKLIWSIVLCGFIFALTVEILLLLPSTENWQDQNAFEKVFGYMLRFTTTGTLGLLAGLFVNCYFIAKTKILIMGKYFWLRSVGAVVLGEAVHISIYIFFTFFDRMSFEEIFQIARNVYVYKIFCVALLSLPGQLIVMFLKNKENLDYYDYEIQFNPFKLHTSS